MSLVDDLIACGNLPKHWLWKKLFYALKDEICKEYGQFDGWDLQVWLDGWTYQPCEHRHILERYMLNGHVFHRPTNEFSYFNFEYQHGRQSDRYRVLVTDCKNVIEGKKEWGDIGVERYEAGWKALKRLVREHGGLLRGRKKQMSFLEVE